MHSRHGPCTSAGHLTLLKLALHKAGHLHCNFRTRRARQQTAPQGSDLRCTLGAAPTPQRTQPALLRLALYPRHGACTIGAYLSFQELALHEAGHLHCTFSTCRARQLTARQGSRCMSGATLGPQGPGQHPWDLNCIDTTPLARPALALPTRNWPCTRPATCTAPLALAGQVSHLHRNPAARAACRGLLWVPMDPTSSLGTCAASMPRRLHVQRLPYPPETDLAQTRLLTLHL